MNIFHRTKIITVSDPSKKVQIQELLAKHNIEYTMKAKELLQKNAIDAARAGTLGMNKAKLNYSFYVQKQTPTQRKVYCEAAICKGVLDKRISF